MRLPRMALWACCLFACAAGTNAQTLPAELTLPIINPGTTNNLPGIVGVRHAGDGSDRLFAIVRGGKIRVFDAQRVLLTMPFLDFAANPPPLGFTVPPSSFDERGLLGLAFHPEYVSNGKFYVYYLDSNSNSVVTEYTVSSEDPNVADTDSPRVILRVYQPYTNHNGGDIHFGADGYLYIGMGDGGSADDPCNSGQSLTSATMNNSAACVADASFIDEPDPQPAPLAAIPQGQATSRALLGKMLRIDVDTTDTPAGADLCGADTDVRRYGIPADNPFAGDAGGNAAACDETYHYGLRNPFRFSFDRQTHDLIIGDVGQYVHEELNLVGPAGGLNFGWDLCEGFHQRQSTTVDCPLPTATDPIIAYTHDVGPVITGGFRYRGPYPDLQGILFFAEAYQQQLFYATENAGNWTWDDVPVGNGIGTIVGFGEDEAGHLYLTTLEGRVRRFTLPEPVVEISVTKQATFTTDTGTPGQGDPGDVVSYSVLVTNTGDATVTDLVVEDSFAGGAPQTLSCVPTTLDAEDVAICVSYEHTITQGEFDAGVALGNVAEATALDPDENEVVASANASIDIGPAEAVLTLAIDTQVASDDGDAAADAGEHIVSTFTVTNDGDVTIAGVALTATPGGVLACEPAVLAPQAVAACGSIDTTTGQSDVDAGLPIAHAASVQGASARGDIVSDSGQTSTPVGAAAPALQAAIELVLQNDVDGDGLVDEGDTVQVDVTVDNTGNVTLGDVAIAVQPGGAGSCAPATIAPEDAPAACGPVSYMVQPGDFAAGLLRVTAIATANPPGDVEPVMSAEVEATLVADRPTAIFDDDFEGG